LDDLPLGTMPLSQRLCLQQQSAETIHCLESESSKGSWDCSNRHSSGRRKRSVMCHRGTGPNRSIANSPEAIEEIDKPFPDQDSNKISPDSSL
jgi:hypothetical protein